MSELADIQLPVFPFRINWREGVTERPIWKTDVLGGDTGNEQRQALRLSPRREFDVTLTLFDRERAFHDLWLHRMLAHEIMFPVWHDATNTTAAAAAGATGLALDTTYLGFEPGGLAILFGADAFNNETVQIDDVTDAGITLTAPLRQRWSKGTKIAPMLRGYLSEEGASASRGSRAAWEVSARFETNRPNDYGLGSDDSDQYLGLPVMMTAPDGKEDTDYDYAWDIEELDNDTGRKDRLTVQERAFTTQKISHLLQGRAQKAAMRQFLYRQQGRFKPLWLPTFNQDLVLAKDAGLGQGYLEVKQTGYRYTGGVIDGRKHIVIRTNAGTSYHRITAAQAASTGAREKLLITPPLPRAVEASSVKMISFMDTARLDSDQIEMHHRTDADGVTTVQLPYRTFSNNRTAPTPISLPIPDAIKTPGACGSAAPETDDCNPTAAAFDGWWLKFRVDTFWAGVCGPTEFPNSYLQVYAGTEYTDNQDDMLSRPLDAAHQGDGSPGQAVQLEFFSGEHLREGLEYTLWQSANEWSAFPTDPTQGDPRLYMLELQFPAGIFTCIFDRFATVSVRRWYEETYTVIPCAWGNTVPLKDGVSFDIEGIWPRLYGFIF